MRIPGLKTPTLLNEALRDNAPVAHATAGASPVHDGATAHGGAYRPSLGRRVWRVVRDLTIGVSLVAAIPLAIIQLSATPLQQVNFGNMRANLLQAERLRSLRHADDPSISPAQAGQALHRLVPVDERELFPLAAPAAVPFPWQDAPLDSTLFIGVRGTRWRGPDPTKIIAAAAKGLPARDRAWLRDLAGLRLWTDVELVARAERVDVLGGRFRVPFRADAWRMAMPMPRFDALRQLASAGVARAAHLVAVNEPARAEAALQDVVSLGFVLRDNGTTMWEAMMGREVTEIGRDGLHQLYRTGYRADRLAMSAPNEKLSEVVRPALASKRSLEADALRDVTDATLPRAYRVERFGHLMYASCSSAWTVVRGPSPAVRAAIDDAPATLARFESERANLALLRKDLMTVPTREVPRSGGMLELVQGAANVTSTLTGNVRIASCTRAIIGDFTYR